MEMIKALMQRWESPIFDEKNKKWFIGFDKGSIIIGFNGSKMGVKGRPKLIEGSDMAFQILKGSAAQFIGTALMDNNAISINRIDDNAWDIQIFGIMESSKVIRKTLS